MNQTTHGVGQSQSKSYLEKYQGKKNIWHLDTGLREEWIIRGWRKWGSCVTGIFLCFPCSFFPCFLCRQHVGSRGCGSLSCLERRHTRCRHWCCWLHNLCRIIQLPLVNLSYMFLSAIFQDALKHFGFTSRTSCVANRWILEAISSLSVVSQSLLSSKVIKGENERNWGSINRMEVDEWNGRKEKRCSISRPGETRSSVIQQRS